MAKRQRKSALDQLTVRAIPSRYTEGAWSEVRATIRWRLGSPITNIEERDAVATAHRLAADLLDAIPPDAEWCLPTIDLVTSYGDVVEVAVAIELAHGTEAEAKRAADLFTEITAHRK